MRFKALDGWRGLCALVVALFHLNVYSHFYGFEIIRNAYLFVDFFFVLSGFVVTSAYLDRLTSRSDVLSFIVRRFGRLWPLHAAVLGLFILLELVKMIAVHLGLSASTEAFSDNRSVEAILTNILLIQSLGVHSYLTWNFPSWSISCEFYTYIIFAAIQLAFVNNRKIKLTVFVSLIITCIAIIVMFSHNGQDTTYDYGILRCLSGFLCGSITYLFYKTRLCNIYKIATFLELFSLFFVICFVTYGAAVPYAYAAPLLFSVVVWVYAHQEGKLSLLLLSSPVQKLGEWSYSIYMIQAFVVVNLVNRPITILERVLGYPLTIDARNMGIDLGPDIQKLITLGNQYQADILVFIYIGAVILLARNTYKYIEVPSRDYFNKVAQHYKIKQASRT